MASITWSQPHDPEPDPRASDLLVYKVELSEPPSREWIEVFRSHRGWDFHGGKPTVVGKIATFRSAGQGRSQEPEFPKDWQQFQLAAGEANKRVSGSP